jgi:hypothetical protein
MANFDPDLIPMFEAIESRLLAIETRLTSVEEAPPVTAPDDSEAQASIDFNAELFAVLRDSDDRVAVWRSLADFLRTL